MTQLNASQLASVTSLIDTLDEFSEGRKNFGVDQLSVLDDEGNQLGYLNFDGDGGEYVWRQSP